MPFLRVGSRELSVHVSSYLSWHQRFLPKSAAEHHCTVCWDGATRRWVWPPSKKPPSLACVVCCIPSLSSLFPLAHWLVGLWPPHSRSTSRASCCVCRRIEAFCVWNGASVATLWTTLVRSTAMQPCGCFPQRRYRNGHRVALLAPSVSGMCSYHAHAVSRRSHGARWAQGWQRPRSTGGSVRVATWRCIRVDGTENVDRSHN